jgi:hypothetical protein
MSLLAIKTAIKGALGGEGKVISAVSELIDQSTFSKEEREQKKIEFAKLHADDERAREENVTKQIELAYKDTADARALQVAALNQDDKFSKRYVYYLSSFIIFSAVAFGTMLFFVNVPPQNQRMVEMFSDVFLFAGGMTIINFFFGSSSGAKKNAETVREVAKEKIRS